MNALVVIGSSTSERDFGLAAGRRVAQALRERGWKVNELDAAQPIELIRLLTSAALPDVVVPVGYGHPVEDGAIHTVVTLSGTPCSGPSALAGAAGVDKTLFALVVRGLFSASERVRATDGCVVGVDDLDEDAKRRIARLSPPLIVKSNCGGSSIGLAVTESHAAAFDAARRLGQTEGDVLVQTLVRPSREFSIAVLDLPSGSLALPIAELLRNDVMGFAEKFGPTAREHHVIPAPLDAGTAARLEDVALRLHAATKQCGLARYDLLLQNGIIVPLEVNPVAGMLESSIAVDCAKAAGIDFGDLAEAYARSAFLPQKAPSISMRPIRDNGSSA